MFLSLRNIVDEIATEHCTEIDIWDKLVHYFTEYWDGDDHIFQQVLNLSRRQLGEQTQTITDTASFFTALENKFSDKNDLLEFLINLTGYLNYHTELGSVNVKQHLKDCRENIRRFKRECIRKGIFRDNNFVGREDQIAKIKDEIEKGNTKGILVCGLGGMGKTCLVNTVCYELRSDKWKTIRFELREQRNYRHFLRTVVNKFKELRGSSSGNDSNIGNVDDKENQDEMMDEEMILQQKFVDYFRKQLGNETVSKKQILMFDNIDDVTTNPDEKKKLLVFFKTLLEMMQSSQNCMMRIIITSRDNFLLTTGIDLVYCLVKVEVTSLDRDNANKLVAMCTKQSNLDIKQIKVIVRVCGACPLALRVICDAINIDPNIDQLIKFLEKRTESLPTPVLSMTDCLNQPFINLGNYKYTLCKLSLFGTSKFSLKSAAIIDHNELEIDDRNKPTRLGDLKITLLLFKSRHLIEIENDIGDKCYTKEMQNESELLMADQEIFSLHPLVYKFLREKEHEADIAPTMEKAKLNYVKLFDEIVLDIAKEYEINVLAAREKSEKLKVPIAKYMQLMEDYEKILELSCMQGFISTEVTKRRNNVAMMILNPEQHLSYIQVMSSKHWANPLIKVSWQVEHVTAMVNYDRTCTDIEEICSDILNTLHDYRTDHLSDEEKSQLFIMHGRMIYNRGLLKMDTDSKESVTYLKKAETIFKSKEFRSKQERKMYLADIYNCLGCVYYRQKETEKAIQFHEKALEGQSHNQNERHLTYLANIGACHFRLGIQHMRDKEKEKCEREMKKALKFYNDSIIVAKALKMDRTDRYLNYLKHRGDVLAMLNQYKEAKKDYQECLDIVKTWCVSPIRKEILFLHAQGTLIRRIIASKARGSFSNDVMDEEGNPEESYNVVDLVDEGVEIYEGLKDMLNSDIFPGDHDSFNKIKKNHLFFLKQQHQATKSEDTEKFYSAYLTRGLDDDTDRSSSSPTSSSTDSGEGCGDETENKPHNRSTSISPMHSDIEDEGASNETNIHGCTVDRNGMMDKKQQFKLPLSAKRCVDEISYRSPQKRTNRRESSSSSGVSSMGSFTPDVEKASLGQFTEVLQSSLGSSFEDDVFQKTKTENSDRNETKTYPRWVKRRSTFSSFGSGSLEECAGVGEKIVQIEKKRKIETTISTSVSLDETLSRSRFLKRQKSEDWMIKEKLSPFFEDRQKDSSSQTDSRNIDNIVDELEDLIPSVQPRIRYLIKELDSRKARLIDDVNGKPTIQYKDEGFFDDTGS